MISFSLPIKSGIAKRLLTHRSENKEKNQPWKSEGALSEVSRADMFKFNNKDMTLR